MTTNTILFIICFFMTMASSTPSPAAPTRLHLVGDGSTTSVGARHQQVKYVPEAVTIGQSIYASHHSYFLGVPETLAELAGTGGFPDQKILGSHYIGGSKSIDHWNIPDADNKAKEALSSGNVDVLILTPIYLPDGGIERFARLGLEHNPKIRVTVMEFWLPFDVYNPVLYDVNYVPRPEEPPLMSKPDQVNHNAANGKALQKTHEYYFQTMDNQITALNKKLGREVLFVVPMGQAVIALREKIVAGQAPGVKDQEQLFADQLGHPGPVMQALEAYCHYAVIYRKNPVGLPAPAILTKAPLPPEDLAALNRLLQEIAWEAVIQHPLSGVTAKAGQSLLDSLVLLPPPGIAPNSAPQKPAPPR